MRLICGLLALLLLSSCGDDPAELDIVYPATGAYGMNILSTADTVWMTTQDASMKAEVPEGKTLKVELTLIAGEPYFYADPQNWTVSDFQNGTQTYEVLNPGAAELKFHNMDTTNVDVISLRYFENSASVTRTQILIRK